MVVSTIYASLKFKPQAVGQDALGGPKVGDVSIPGNLRLKEQLLEVGLKVIKQKSRKSVC